MHSSRVCRPADLEQQYLGLSRSPSGDAVRWKSRHLDRVLPSLADEHSWSLKAWHAIAAFADGEPHDPFVMQVGVFLPSG